MEAFEVRTCFRVLILLAFVLGTSSRTRNSKLNMRIQKHGAVQRIPCLAEIRQRLMGSSRLALRISSFLDCKSIKEQQVILNEFIAELQEDSNPPGWTKCRALQTSAGMALLGIYSADEGCCFTNRISEVLSKFDEVCLVQACSLLLQLGRDNDETDWFFEIGFRNLLKLKQRSFLKEAVALNKGWIFSRLVEMFEKDLVTCNRQPEVLQDDIHKKMQVCIGLLDLSSLTAASKFDDSESCRLEPSTFDKLFHQANYALQNDNFSQELRKTSSVLLTKLIKSHCPLAAESWKYSFYELLSNSCSGKIDALKTTRTLESQGLNVKIPEIRKKSCIYGSICLLQSFMASEEVSFFNSDSESPDNRLWDWIVKFADLVSQESEVRELFQTLSLFVRTLSATIHQNNLNDDACSLYEIFHDVNVSSVMYESFRIMARYSNAVSSGPLQYRIREFFLDTLKMRNAILASDLFHEEFKSRIFDLWNDDAILVRCLNMNSLQKGKFLLLSALVDKLSSDGQFWNLPSLSHFKILIEEAFTLTDSPSHAFAAKRFLESCSSDDLAKNHDLCSEMWLHPTVRLLLHYKHRELVSTLVLQRLVHQIPHFAESLLRGFESILADYESLSNDADEDTKMDMHERILWAKLTILKHRAVDFPPSGYLEMDKEEEEEEGNKERARDQELIQGAISCASSEIRIQALESIFFPVLSSRRRLNDLDVSRLRLAILFECDNPSRASRRKVLGIIAKVLPLCRIEYRRQQKKSHVEKSEGEGEDIFRWLFQTIPGWIKTSAGTGLARKDFALELMMLILDVWLPSSSAAPDDRMLQLAALEENTKRTLDRMFTPDLLTSLSMCLLHMFDSIRQKASCIISRLIPLYKEEFVNQRQFERLEVIGSRLVTSLNSRDASSGALILKTSYILKQLEESSSLKSDLDQNMSKTFESKIMKTVNAISHWPLLSVQSCDDGRDSVMRHFQQRGFIHGHILTTRLLLDSGSYDSILKENKQIYQLLLNTTHEIVQTAKSLLDDELVCAGMMNENLSPDEFELMDDEDRQQDFSRNSNLELCSQRACWLTLKESAFLLSSLCKRSSFQKDCLDQELLDKIVDDLFLIIFATSHNGLVEQSAEALRQVCMFVVDNDGAGGKSYLTHWMSKLIALLPDPSVAAVRRSSQISHAITAILSVERGGDTMLKDFLPQIIRLVDPKDLRNDGTCTSTSTKSTFLSSASIGLPIDKHQDPVDVASRLHALHVIRQILLHAKVGSKALDVLGDEILCSIATALSSQEWMIRNAANLAFSAAIERSLGKQENYKSSDHFFRLFPEFQRELLGILEEESKQKQTGKAAAISRVLPCLCLLAKLRTESISSQPFISRMRFLAIELLSHEYEVVRESAALAAVALTERSKLCDVAVEISRDITKLASGIQNDDDASNNILHGQILFLRTILTSSAQLSDADSCAVFVSLLEASFVELADKPVRLLLLSTIEAILVKYEKQIQTVLSQESLVDQTLETLRQLVFADKLYEQVEGKPSMSFQATSVLLRMMRMKLQRCPLNLETFEALLSHSLDEVKIAALSHIESLLPKSFHDGRLYQLLMSKIELETNSDCIRGILCCLERFPPSAISLSNLNSSQTKASQLLSSSRHEVTSAALRVTANWIAALIHQANVEASMPSMNERIDRWVIRLEQGINPSEPQNLRRSCLDALGDSRILTCNAAALADASSRCLLCLLILLQDKDPSIYEKASILALRSVDLSVVGLKERRRHPLATHRLVAAICLMRWICLRCAGEGGKVLLVSHMQRVRREFERATATWPQYCERVGAEVQGDGERERKEVVQEEIFAAEDESYELEHGLILFIFSDAVRWAMRHTGMGQDQARKLLAEVGCEEQVEREWGSIAMEYLEMFEQQR